MKPFAFFYIILLFLVAACSSRQKDNIEVVGKEIDLSPAPSGENPKAQNTHIEDPLSNLNIDETSLVVLGTIQDAGSPHIACTKDCCKDLFLIPDYSRKVISLGLIDPIHGKKFIIDATPDFTEQVKILKKLSSFSEKETPDGIILTHAHIGHYTGLMYLGKEAMNAKKVPVFAMHRMKSFLEQNGPWDQLVTNNNISIQELNNQQETALTPNLKLIPFEVPHRDEYSETVGFIIVGPHKKVLFIPDIDKWEQWEQDIIKEISKVDYAFIDGTFFDAEEVNNRNISEIPHPFISESMKKFNTLSFEEKKKIYFIHFNHTNPVINSQSPQAQEVQKNGFNVSSIYTCIKL